MFFKDIRLGLRTIKTGISVFLCILLYGILGWGSPLIAALSAVFSMREDLGTSIKFGGQRIFGNIIGSFFSVAVIFLVSITNNVFLTQLIAIPLSVMAIIILCDASNNNMAIIAGCATFLAILFITPDLNPLAFAFARVIDTLIGATISLAVNHFIKSPRSSSND
ncbi:MAG: FUSC family protein [Culicoidibacterales bacterium]